MKKFLAFGAVFAALALAITCFTSCKDEEEENSSLDAINENVVSQWTGTTEYFPTTQTLTFYKDGTFTSIETTSMFGMSETLRAYGTYTGDTTRETDETNVITLTLTGGNSDHELNKKFNKTSNNKTPLPVTISGKTLTVNNVDYKLVYPATGFVSNKGNVVTEWHWEEVIDMVLSKITITTDFTFYKDGTFKCVHTDGAPGNYETITGTYEGDTTKDGTITMTSSSDGEFENMTIEIKGDTFDFDTQSEMGVITLTKVTTGNSTSNTNKIDSQLAGSTWMTPDDDDEEIGFYLKGDGTGNCVYKKNGTYYNVSDAPVNSWSVSGDVLTISYTAIISETITGIYSINGNTLTYNNDSTLYFKEKSEFTKLAQNPTLSDTSKNLIGF